MEFTPRHLNVRASDGRVFMRRAFANITSSPPSERFSPPAAFVKGFRLSVLSQQKMQEALGRAEAEEAALECERAAVEVEGKEAGVALS